MTIDAALGGLAAWVPGITTAKAVTPLPVQAAADCPIEWIITKSALQEGWDCPFAYVLVSLANTGSKQAMTQLVGRVLRQPFAKKTPFPGLNECYVFCRREQAGETVKGVKWALEKEGYEGELSSAVKDHTGVQDPGAANRAVSIRPEILKHYGKPFEGRIFLPRFCVKSGANYESLDYYRHLLSRVDVTAFDYGWVGWDLQRDLAEAKDAFYRLTIGQSEPDGAEERRAVTLETGEQVRAWLVGSLGFDYLSYRELLEVVRRSLQQLMKATPSVCNQLGLVKFPARDRVHQIVERGVDAQTQAAFEDLYHRDQQ